MAGLLAVDPPERKVLSFALGSVGVHTVGEVGSSRESLCARCDAVGAIRVRVAVYGTAKERCVLCCAFCAGAAILGC